jgi:hypothetical protein
MRSSKKIVISWTFALGLCVGTGFAMADGRDGHMDTAPGPAYTTVDGKVSKIEGGVYTVQSESANYQNLGTSKNVSEVKIFVNEQTKKLHGDKKVGDKIRAEITEGGFANSIQ